MTIRDEPATQRSFLASYRERLADGWQEDAAQEAAVSALNALLMALRNGARDPKGVYLHGPVGRGKSELLSLFLQQLGPVTYRRVHFHAFMAELHQRIHAIRGGDPVEHIARDLASQYRVLGFDEFYVTNIADAMLLGRLFQHLFKNGVVVVATSNWPMDDLFQNGRNRMRFLPFIRLIKANLQAVDLGNGADYRQREDESWPLYVVPPGRAEDAGSDLQTLFEYYAEAGEPRGYAPIAAKAFRGRAAWFDFPEVCMRALGAAEYLALLEHADTVLIEGVPVLGPNDSDAALRLVSLIDVCYEKRRRVVISAAAYPDALYAGGPVEAAFRRVASRLSEMQGWA